MKVQVINRRGAPHINYVMTQPLPNGWYFRVDMRDYGSPSWRGRDWPPKVTPKPQPQTEALWIFPTHNKRHQPIAEVRFIFEPGDRGYAAYNNQRVTLYQSCKANFDVVILTMKRDLRMNIATIIDPGETKAVRR